MTDDNAYDLVPYPSYAHPQACVWHMEATASLLGMTPVPATTCRVLEIGSGVGSGQWTS